MTLLDERLRAALTELAPEVDLPVDLPDRIRRRVRRTHARRAAALTAAVAGTAAAVFTVSGLASGSHEQTVSPTGTDPVAVPTHVPGVPGDGYLLGSDWRGVSAYSFLTAGRPAIGLTHSRFTVTFSGWLPGHRYAIAVHQVQGTPQLLGFADPATSHVVLTFRSGPAATIRIPALATPTSTQVRFFEVPLVGHNGGEMPSRVDLLDANNRPI